MPVSAGEIRAPIPSGPRGLLLDCTYGFPVTQDPRKTPRLHSFLCTHGRTPRAPSSSGVSVCRPQRFASVFVARRRLARYENSILGPQSPLVSLRCPARALLDAPLRLPCTRVAIHRLNDGGCALDRIYRLYLSRYPRHECLLPPLVTYLVILPLFCHTASARYAPTICTSVHTVTLTVAWFSRSRDR